MRIRWTAGKRFLHPLLSELRGHGKGSRAGNGKPGASEVVAGLENPSCMRRRRDAERNKSSEAAEYTSYIGRGALPMGGSCTGRKSGLSGRENAGMSSEIEVRIF